MKCCLCGALSKTKKGKKLYGMSCTESRVVLERVVLQKTGFPLTCFAETQANAWLCPHCDGKLDRLGKLEEEISKHVMALHHLVSSESGQTQRKRVSVHDVPHHQKRTRVESLPSQEATTLADPHLGPQQLASHPLPDLRQHPAGSPPVPAGQPNIQPSQGELLQPPIEEMQGSPTTLSTQQVQPEQNVSPTVRVSFSNK